LVLATLLFGCSGAIIEDAPTVGPPVIASATTEDQTCARDAECVLVQDCCGCERQGRQLAVHRDRVAALTETSEAECSTVGCRVAPSEHRSCRTERAVCRGGRCIPAID
jgi:hypothetical protein